MSDIIKNNDLIDPNNQTVLPGSRIIKGYWGKYIVFGSPIKGSTLELKIRLKGENGRIRLINPLMTPDNNWEDKKSSVEVDWGDGNVSKYQKKLINSGRFNRERGTKIEHGYLASDGEEFKIRITTNEPLIPYGCEIIEMLGQFPYDRYDLNTDSDGKYCGLFGVNQFIPEYPELNKLYGAGKTIEKVSSELLDNWMHTKRMDYMFCGWGLKEVPDKFFKWYNKFYPEGDPNNEYHYTHNEQIIDTCESYVSCFENCVNLTKIPEQLISSVVSSVRVLRRMFANCVKLQNGVRLYHGRNLVDASYMFYNCKELTRIRWSFLSGADKAVTDPEYNYDEFRVNKLETIESIFEGCVKLTEIDWEHFLGYSNTTLKNAKNAFKNTGFSTVAFRLDNKTDIETIEGMYSGCVNLRTVKCTTSTSTASKWQFERHNGPNGNKKLNISHLFEGSGDRTLGMIIEKDFFANLGSINRKVSETDGAKYMAVNTNATHILANAVIDKMSDASLSDPLHRAFDGVFGSHDEWRLYKDTIAYDISHIFDGVRYTCGFVTYDFALSNCWNIEKMDYAYANQTIDNMVTWNLFGYSHRAIKSIEGLFYNSTINYRFDTYSPFFASTQGIFNADSYFDRCTNFSKMFMNVKYKFAQFPVDHILKISKKVYDEVDKNAVIDTTDMFTGSNIQCYRPIHPETDRRLTFNCANLIARSTAPKEWMMNGYTDISTWTPQLYTKPWIMYINTIKKDPFDFHLSKAPAKVDWGDGSTTSEATHHYAKGGVYKITITDSDVCQPVGDDVGYIFKLDGELPYGTTYDFTYHSYLNRISEVGPSFCCLARNVRLDGMSGYLFPENGKYGSNVGLQEGLLHLDIVDPVTPAISFSMPSVYLDKTVSMDITITNEKFCVDDTTTVNITSGMDRVKSDRLQPSIYVSDLLWIPTTLFNMHELNQPKDAELTYEVLNILDNGYCTSKQFGPNVTQFYGLTMCNIGAVEWQPSELRVSPSINSKNYPKLTHFGPNSDIGRVKMACDDNGLPYNLRYDTRGPKIVRDYIDFELHNVDDELTFFRLDLLPNTKHRYEDRPIGTGTIQLFYNDEQENISNPERIYTFDNQLLNLGHIKADRLIVRITADVPLWVSCTDKIYAIYGTITNKEGDLWIHQYDLVMNQRGNEYISLAPNIHFISEDLLWGLNDHEQAYTNTFSFTQLEVVPQGLFNYYFGYIYGSMFRGCKNLKSIPDYLIKKNTLKVKHVTCTWMFAECTNIEYVFKPFAPDVNVVFTYGMLEGCKTYAFKDVKNIDAEIIKNISGSYSEFERLNTSGNVTGIVQNSLANNTNVPLLDLEHDTILAEWNADNKEIYKVANIFPLFMDFRPYKDVKLARRLSRLQHVWHFQGFNPMILNDTNGTFGFNATQLSELFHSMPSLKSYHPTYNLYMMNKTPDAPENVIHHDTFMLNTKCTALMNVLGYGAINYTPNLLFLHQPELRDATMLLRKITFTSIEKAESYPATHLDTFLGKPIHLGDKYETFGLVPRDLDRLLRYRRYFVRSGAMFDDVKGDVECPKFPDHTLLIVDGMFTDSVVRVDDDTFGELDRSTDLYKIWRNNVVASFVFQNNDYVTTDCRVFDIWPETIVGNDVFADTENLIHPRPDMLKSLTSTDTLASLFRDSQIRSLPDCNPIISNYYKFARNTKIAQVPKHYFNYNGTETLDIRSAFENCTSLVITAPIIDPSVTAPVTKYASLKNAWSIIGDDDVIFAGVNTKLDGTDRSLVKLIPEEDVFHQTINVKQDGWTVSISALGVPALSDCSLADGEIFVILWGDDTSSAVSGRQLKWEDYSHIYDKPGRYQVSIANSKWCCYVHTPYDTTSSLDTYSIDSMLQNTTCAEIRDITLYEMFGPRVNKVSGNLFDKCPDVGTITAFPDMFRNLDQLREIPYNVLSKMTNVEDLTCFARDTHITSIDARVFANCRKLKKLHYGLTYCNLTDSGIPETLFANNQALEDVSYLFTDLSITALPRKIFHSCPNILNAQGLVRHDKNFILDNTYDDFFAHCTKLNSIANAFENIIIKQLPPNFLNRCTALRSAWSALCIWDPSDKVNENALVPSDDHWQYYADRNALDSDFTIPNGFFPPSVVDVGWTFGHRRHCKGYGDQLFTNCRNITSFFATFIGTGIKTIHPETVRTQTGSEINCQYMFYKDKRLKAPYYIHNTPRVVSSAITGKVYTENMLLGCFGEPTEAELFAGVTTSPTDIRSRYGQEYPSTTFKIKINRDGVLIRMRPVMKDMSLMFDGMNAVTWGDGSEIVYDVDMPIPAQHISAIYSHQYKAGTYTIIASTKYCVVPIADGEETNTYDVLSTKVNVPEEVKVVSIAPKYGKSVFSQDNEYNVDIEIDRAGLKVGDTTELEVELVERGFTPQFERLEIGGVLNFMQGYSEFPIVYKHPEWKYAKWIGDVGFFKRNTQITSMWRAFSNIPEEIRFANNVFGGLINLVHAEFLLYNTNYVLESEFAPDFNKCTQLTHLTAMFRVPNHTTLDRDKVFPDGDKYVPDDIPRSKGKWLVGKEYQPFEHLQNIEYASTLAYDSGIKYPLRINFHKIKDFGGMYQWSDLIEISSDYFRTMNSTPNSSVNAAFALADTYYLQVMPATDGKTLLEWNISDGQRLDFSFIIAGRGPRPKHSVSFYLELINKSSIINTTAKNTNLSLYSAYSWSSHSNGQDGFALHLVIPNRIGTLNISYLLSPSQHHHQYPDPLVKLHNIRKNAVEIQGSDITVHASEMFDHCFINIDSHDIADAFNVIGDDADKTKAKKLADDSKLCSFTVMDTTATPVKPSAIVFTSRSGDYTNYAPITSSKPVKLTSGQHDAECTGIQFGDGGTHDSKNGVSLIFNAPITWTEEYIKISISEGNIFTGDIRNTKVFYAKPVSGTNRLWLNNIDIENQFVKDNTVRTIQIEKVDAGTNLIHVRHYAHDLKNEWDYYGVAPLRVPNPNFDLINETTYELYDRNMYYNQVLNYREYNSNSNEEEFWFDERCWSKYPEDKIITVSELVSKYNSNLSGLRILVYNDTVNYDFPFGGLSGTPDLIYADGGLIRGLPGGNKYSSSNSTIIAPHANHVRLFTNSVNDFNSRLIAPKCTYLVFDMRSVSRVRDDAIEIPQSVTSISFNQCAQLTAIPRFLSKMPLVNVSHAFSQCTNITTIPSWIFKSARLQNVSYCFTLCSKLQRVESNVFNKSNIDSSLLSFDHVFEDCSHLESVPSDLFVGCERVTDINSVFYQCEALQTLPDGIFTPLTNLQVAKHALSFSGLTKIPTSFMNLANLTNISGCFFATEISSIPDLLFTKMTNLKVCSNTFGSNKLTSIPDNLLMNNHNLLNVDKMFSTNVLLTYSPVNLFLPCATSLLSATDVFDGCFKLPASCIPDFTDKSVYPNIK